MAYASFSVVFGEQPSAAKWNILGTNDASFNDGTGIAVSAITPEKLLTGTGTSWVYTSYAPTLTNITIGNGTTVSYYRQTGKKVHFYGKVTAGTTTSFATDARISLPVNAAATSPDRLSWGNGILFDTSASAYYQVYMVKYPSAQTTWFLFMAVSTTPSYPPQTGAFPVAAGTGDELLWSIVYEAA